MIEREIAHRLFAKEFNNSIYLKAYHLNEFKGSKASKLLFSPTGLPINRVFIVGVITEIQNILSKNNNLWKARVSDPTGTFIIYAGKYQPDAAFFISTVDVPSYVAVVGKVRFYESKDRVNIISIRAEEINNVDSFTRNSWVIDAAISTLQRLKFLDNTINNNAINNEENMSDMLKLQDLNSLSLEVINELISFYGINTNYIKEYQQDVYKALLAIKENIDSQFTQKNININQIQELLITLDQGKGVSYNSLMSIAQNKSIPKEIVNEILHYLLESGECYQPRNGILKLVQ